MQQALPLSPAFSPSFENFVAAPDNAALLALLQQAQLPRLIYWWGQNGCSHLLHAFANARSERWRQKVQKPLWITEDSGPAKPLLWLERDGYQAGAIHCLDDLDRADLSLIPTLLQLINRLETDDSHLVISAHCPPTALPYSAQLQSRLNAELVFELRPLKDDDAFKVLRQQAQNRGFQLSEAVLQYCFTHLKRDLRSLLQLLTELDRYSLAIQRHITVPLVREWLSQNVGKTSHNLALTL